MRVTIVVTCSLSARPEPVTAAFTSLGVCSATGSPRLAATTIATPAACAVPLPAPRRAPGRRPPPHPRPDVQLGERPPPRHRVRPVLGDPLLDPRFDPD